MKENKLAFGVLGAFLAVALLIVGISIYSQPVAADGGQPGQSYGCGVPFETGYLDGTWCPVETPYPEYACSTDPENPQSCISLCVDACVQHDAQCGWTDQQFEQCSVGCGAGIYETCNPEQ